MKRTKLPRHVRRHRDRFRAVITLEGRRIVGPLRPTAAEAAVDAADLLRRRSAPPPRILTLRDGYALLQAELAASARPATLAYYAKGWARITQAWAEDTPLHRVSAKGIAAYAAQRQADGVSRETIWSKELQVLQRILRLPACRACVPTDPFAEVRKPRLRQSHFAWIPHAELVSLIAKIRGTGGLVRTAERDADLVALLYLTGVRRAELGRLRADSIDMQAGTIAVEGKTGNRVLPIGEPLRPILARLLLRSGGGPLVRSWRTVEALFLRWRKRLGEPRLSPHVMRHSYGTEQVNRGTPLHVLKVLMGHASIRETEKYLHVVDQQRLDAAGRIQLGEPSPPEAQTAQPTPPPPAAAGSA